MEWLALPLFVPLAQLKRFLKAHAAHDVTQEPTAPTLPALPPPQSVLRDSEESTESAASSAKDRSTAPTLTAQQLNALLAARRS
jgi:hypothetical protein